MQQGQSTLQQIETILPPQLELAPAFAEFVRARAAQAEDEVLWSFVEREQAYRAAHPGDVFTVSTEEDLLAALDVEL